MKVLKTKSKKGRMTQLFFTLILVSTFAGQLAAQDTKIRERNSDKSTQIRITATEALSTALKSQPYYVVNGEVVTSISAINKDDIESINVLKGEKAADKYGDKGENGVVEVTLKEGVEVPKEGAKANPYYMVNGVHVESIENIDPDKIESVHVLKGEAALKKYGIDALNGSVEIKLKK